MSQLAEDLLRSSANDRLTLLSHWLSKPYVRQALFLASPTLWTDAEPWINAPTSTLPDTVEIALWKYLFRMSSRCTPFGLFAGSTLR